MIVERERKKKKDSLKDSEKRRNSIAFFFLLCMYNFAVSLIAKLFNFLFVTDLNWISHFLFKKNKIKIIFFFGLNKYLSTQSNQDYVPNDNYLLFWLMREEHLFRKLFLHLCMQILISKFVMNHNPFLILKISKQLF